MKNEKMEKQRGDLEKSDCVYTQKYDKIYVKKSIFNAEEKRHL